MRGSIKHPCPHLEALANRLCNIPDGFLDLSTAGTLAEELRDLRADAKAALHNDAQPPATPKPEAPSLGSIAFENLHALATRLAHVTDPNRPARDSEELGDLFNSLHRQARNALEDVALAERRPELRTEPTPKAPQAKPTPLVLDALIDVANEAANTMRRCMNSDGSWTVPTTQSLRSLLVAAVGAIALAKGEA